MKESYDPKNIFQGLMSHDIRSTLNEISGAGNLMAETALTTEQRNSLETIQSSTGTLLSLMNDLIDLSHIEAGEFTFDEIEFDLRTAVDEAIETVAHRAAFKEIEMHTLIHASVPETVKGDPARIRQIIVNLAGCVVGLSHSGEIVLTVEAISDELDRVVVRFTIAEFGCGIDENQLQLLFQPVSRPDIISSWKFGKTGLELALSKRFSQLMGGDIGCSSITGKKTTLWFSVGLIKCRPVPQQAAAPLSSLCGMKVIVVEPSASGRRIMAHYLESAGCTCDEFECCENFLEEITNANKAGPEIDAMIVALSQIAGAQYDALARIRRVEALPKIPLVLVTAVGKRGDVQKLREIGAVAYLTRPLKQYQLIETMRLVRGNANLSAQAPGNPFALTTQKSRLITRHTIAEGTVNKKFRILLADDNTSNRKTAKKILDNAGYVCDVAENGADALDAFGKKKYDLIFMDCYMPLMNGCDATTALRLAELRSPGTHIPICAMIASTSPSDAEKCLEAGMDDVILKPFNHGDFIGMVEKWEHTIQGLENVKDTHPQHTIFGPPNGSTRPTDNAGA
jgi:two-component system, sensor histidine kinase and response regulator